MYTQSLGTAQRFIQDIHSGLAHVNEPFGGVGITGVGDREMGEEGVNVFTQLKTVCINYSLSGERSMTR